MALGDSDRAGIDPANDQVPHRWQLFALDRATGKTVWSRTVHQGVPRAKRHVKSSHASATPATNGKIVVAMFDSEGLFAFDANGTELWRKDLGKLALGLADDPTYEWGPASSPVIHGNTVLVQNDRYQDSLPDRIRSVERPRAVAIGARRAARRGRRRSCTSTPARSTVVTISPRFVRGPRFRDRARAVADLPDPDGQVKVSTPVAAGRPRDRDGRLSGGGRVRSSPFARADGSIAWRHERGSPYTSTPLVYDGLLYIVTDNGILSAYQIADGTRVYQQRLPPVAGSFSASPVAADGRIYLASEDGQVFVVRAGPHLRSCSRPTT